MTALLHSSDIKPVTEDVKPGSASASTMAIAELQRIPANQELEATIGQLDPDAHVYFVTNGRWSTHDLLYYLLRQTGPASVWLSTWALSERSVRLLMDGIEEGLIVSLNAVFDKRLKIRKAEVMQLAEHVSHRFCLVDCHAKVFVVTNDAFTVTVVGSANFTNNKRIEAGVICTDPRIGKLQMAWMEEQLSGGDPFD